MSGSGQKREKAVGGSNETFKVFTIFKKVVLKEKTFLRLNTKTQRILSLKVLNNKM